MRRLVVNLSDEQDSWLQSKPNQNDEVRKALDLYMGKVTPDTIAGLRKSYATLTSYMESKFEYYDSVFSQLEKLISVLETRM